MVVGLPYAVHLQMCYLAVYTVMHTVHTAGNNITSFVSNEVQSETHLSQSSTLSTAGDYNYSNKSR